MLSEEDNCKTSASEDVPSTALISRNNNETALGLSHFGPRPGSLIPNHYGQVTPDGTTRGINTVRSSSAIAVRVWENSSSLNPNSSLSSQHSRLYSEAKLELTKLPNWSCMEGASVSILAPRLGDEQIRIIFNKEARTWNAPSEAERQLPAMLVRDLRTLQVPAGSGVRQLLGFSEVERRNVRLELESGSCEEESGEEGGEVFVGSD
jgi:hypothetical protein